MTSNRDTNVYPAEWSNHDGLIAASCICYAGYGFRFPKFNQYLNQTFSPFWLLNWCQLMSIRHQLSLMSNHPIALVGMSINNFISPKPVYFQARNSEGYFVVSFITDGYSVYFGDLMQPSQCLFLVPTRHRALRLQNSFNSSPVAFAGANTVW